MKILVTGSNGYIGSGVVQKLCDDGFDVIAADFQTDKCDARSKKVNCDLFTIENPYEYFERPDVVLHLAWRDGFSHNEISHVVDLPKHYTFLKKMFESETNRIAVMGSMHEIGFWEGSIDENTPCNPMNLYGISKNALRYYVEYLAKTYKKNYQWLRGYYIVGNTFYGSSIFSKIYAAALIEGKTYFPFTKGINQFDFLDYEDFCYRTASVIGQDKINGIINICSGRPEKLSSRVEKFIKDNNLSINLEYGAFPDRPYDSKAVWGNSKRIEDVLLGRKDK